MCSRYSLTLSGGDLVDLFDMDEPEEPPIPGWAAPRFNIAPTDPVPVYLETEKDGTLTERLELARFGLLFPGKPAKFPLINTRVESLDGKSSLSTVFAKRRALVPADGYYEWQKLGGTRQPFYFHGDEPLVFAGLYQWAKGVDGEWILSCSIVTRPPTEAAGRVHDRMPLALPKAFWPDWVSPATTATPELAHAALAASDDVAEALHQYPVGKAVGRVAAEGAQLIEPLPVD